MWRGVSNGRLRGLVVSGMAWLIGLGWLLCPSQLYPRCHVSGSPSSTSELMISSPTGCFQCCATVLCGWLEPQSGSLGLAVRAGGLD